MNSQRYHTIPTRITQITLILILLLLSVGAASAAPAAANTWNALGSGLNDNVRALAFDNSGNLYAGGYFTNAGGNPASRIAKWDGASWSALGGGVNSDVRGLAVDSSGNLYAGGRFSNAGGNAASYIAKWDGTSWSALGSGVGNILYALAVDSSDNLYAGGRFTTAGGIAASRIAKWDGVSWSALGSGVDSIVYALVFDSTRSLYAGGYFTTAGGNPANFIARWELPPPPSAPAPSAPGPGSVPAGEPGGLLVNYPGGDFVFSGGTISAPPGTVPDGTQLFADFTRFPPQVDGMWALNGVVDITLVGPDGNPITSFNPPLEVCLPYTAEDLAQVGGNINNLRVGWAEMLGDAWNLVATYVKPDEMLACAQIGHLTIFGIFEPRLPATGFAPGVVTQVGEPMVDYFPVGSGLVPDRAIVGSGLVPDRAAMKASVPTNSLNICVRRNAVYE